MSRDLRDALDVLDEILLIQYIAECTAYVLAVITVIPPGLSI